MANMTTAPASAGARPKKKTFFEFWNQPKHAAYVFLLPSFLVLTLFVFVPLVAALILGLLNINLFFKDTAFVGFDNFVKAFQDERVPNAFKNTFYFVLLETPVQVFIGLVVAATVAQNTRFNKFVRSVYFIPVVCSMTSIGIIWSLILDSNIGIVPYYIYQLGFQKPLMLRDPNWAMPIVALLTVWKNFGHTMVILVAGIAGISNTYYEAARIDGASSIQQFRHITIPLLIPSLSFCIVTNLIGSFQVFDQVYVATHGGPMHRTETAVQYIYSRAFSPPYELGYASAIAFMLFVVIAVLSLTLNRWLQKREEKMF